MGALRYVCLSDLHLGADYSLLTHMGEDEKTSLARPSETLSAFGRALRATVRRLGDGEPPKLILLGDILDMGLSSNGKVSQGFRRFVEALFPAGEPPAFSLKVLCVPGNHDHHLWRSAQDSFFLEKLPDFPVSSTEIIPSLFRSQLFSQRTARCSLMTELMRGYPHLADASVNVAYPNLGLLGAGGRRCVVLHHGHFIDGLYRAMSMLSGRLAGLDGRPRDVLQLVRENAPWVDFLWSGLGGGGGVERTAVALYETMRNPAASHAFAQRLSALLLEQLDRGAGIAPGTEVRYGVTVENLVRAAIDATLLRGAQTDRDGYFTVMSPESVADLRWYLEGPVRAQLLEAEAKEQSFRLERLDELSFVFGHTHKPFQDQLDIDYCSRPASVYNTGGWVMDQPTMAPAQGAAAVLIDEQMNLASLRLFNDPLNGRCYPAHAAGVGEALDPDNPLLGRLDTAIGEAAGDWSEFRDAVSAAIARHAHSLLGRRYEQELGA